MAKLVHDLVCQACCSDADTCLLDAPGDLLLRHCDNCRLTSVVDPVTTVTYNADYVAQRYDRYETTDRMSGLRLAFVESILTLYDQLPAGSLAVLKANDLILDVGYGNGSFIREANRCCWNAFGYDVNPTDYPGVRCRTLPDPLTDVYRYRVITFFDSLEHFETLHQVRRVSACTDWIFVTAPLPPQGWPIYQGGLRKPWDWKHWRPGEHHHFPHPKTLEHLFTWDDKTAGIRTVATLMHVSHFEDSIRGSGPNGRPNTFSCALRCSVFRNGL